MNWGKNYFPFGSSKEKFGIKIYFIFTCLLPLPLFLLHYGRERVKKEDNKCHIYFELFISIQNSFGQIEMYVTITYSDRSILKPSAVQTTAETLSGHEHNLMYLTSHQGGLAECYPNHCEITFRAELAWVHKS